MKLHHNYAHIGRFADYLRDNGATDLAPNPSWLIHLEGASRRVDGYCARSKFGSGFGPRLGTNRYDAPMYTTNLWLDDDLLSAGTVSTLSTIGGSPTTIGTADYLLQPYQPAPYRSLRIHADSSATWDIYNDVAGTWGYSNDTLAVGTLALASSSATAGTLTAGTAYAGQTLLVGSEQVYVSATAGSAVGGTALTLVRGVNGTTGAAGTAACSTYAYPDEVIQATLQIAMRRWKGRDAGLSGDYGGGMVPVTVQRDSERSILNATVHHLRIYSAG